MSFTVIIPARYCSSRFPGKPLADIHGKPMVQHVYERAAESGASCVVVATDDDRIARAVAAFGGEVCLTSDKHESGTERLAEVVDRKAISQDEIIVNVQGDEPFIPVENIIQVAANLDARSNTQMATLGVPIEQVDEVNNPNIVKVVTDKNGYALYFSRAPIPFDRQYFLDNSTNNSTTGQYLRHVGLYAYRAGFISKYVTMAPSEIEQIESLEQLRVLWHGEKIHVAIAEQAPPHGVDTPNDLAKLLMT